MTRKAVPLTPDELAAFERARQGDVLEQLAGPEANRSEASALNALVRLGLERVRECNEVAGYTALAASQDEEDRAYRAAMRSRRRGGSDAA